MHKPPWGHARSHTKFWPDRFSLFDVYWMHTNILTNKQTDKQSIYIDNVYEKKSKSFTQLPFTETKLVFQIGLRIEEDDLVRGGNRG